LAVLGSTSLVNADLELQPKVREVREVRARLLRLQKGQR
jgi:hypothetical protein